MEDDANQGGLVDAAALEDALEGAGLLGVVLGVEVHALGVHGQLQAAVDGELVVAALPLDHDRLHAELEVGQGLAVCVVQVALDHELAHLGGSEVVVVHDDVVELSLPGLDDQLVLPPALFDQAVDRAGQEVQVERVVDRQQGPAHPIEQIDVFIREVVAHVAQPDQPRELCSHEPVDGAPEQVAPGTEVGPDEGESGELQQLQGTDHPQLPRVVLRE
jgi:hypothetical protein